MSREAFFFFVCVPFTKYSGKMIRFQNWGTSASSCAHRGKAKVSVCGEKEKRLSKKQKSSFQRNRKSRCDKDVILQLVTPLSSGSLSFSQPPANRWALFPATWLCFLPPAGLDRRSVFVFGSFQLLSGVYINLLRRRCVCFLFTLSRTKEDKLRLLHKRLFSLSFSPSFFFFVFFLLPPVQRLAAHQRILTPMACWVSSNRCPWEGHSCLAQLLFSRYLYSNI